MESRKLRKLIIGGDFHSMGVQCGEEVAMKAFQDYFAYPYSICRHADQ